MSAPRFTPAPWKALPCIKREGHTIYSEGGTVVANTGTHSAGGDEPANARLIAAAPELYDALAPFARKGGGWDLGDVHRARVALAKVRGDA